MDEATLKIKKGLNELEVINQVVHFYQDLAAAGLDNETRTCAWLLDVLTPILDEDFAADVLTEYVTE